MADKPCFTEFFHIFDPHSFLVFSHSLMSVSTLRFITLCLQSIKASWFGQFSGLYSLVEISHRHKVSKTGVPHLLLI